MVHAVTKSQQHAVGEEHGNVTHAGARIQQGKSVDMSCPHHVSLPSSPLVVGPSKPLRERVAMSVGKEDRA